MNNTTQQSFFRDDDEDDVHFTKKPEVPEHLDDEKKEKIGEIEEVAVQYDVNDGQPTFKSDKEKECWALFKKMTAKGVSVTFDTVLRFETSLSI